MLKTGAKRTRNRCVNLQNRERPPSFTAFTIKVGTLTSGSNFRSVTYPVLLKPVMAHL